MAVNTLTAAIQPLLALGLISLRSRSILPRLVNRGYEPTPGTKMSSVSVIIPSAITATDVVPAHTAPDTGAIVPTSVNIVVDQWKEAAFTMTDKDLMQVSRGILPPQAGEAIKALANAVESHLWGKFLEVPYVNGTAGTTPFAVSANSGLNDMAVYINARAAMNARDIPDDFRYAVVNPTAAGNLLNGRQFTDASWRGDTGGIINGAIGTKLGSSWAESSQVPTNLATTLSAGAMTVNGVNAAGATVVSFAKATNTAPLLRGNILTIATGPAAGTYRVAADVGLIVGNTNVTLTTGLRGATAGGESVTLTATAVNNVLFHRDAVSFITRPLSESVPDGGAGLAAFDYIVDPVTGLTLRLELTREYKQWRWAYDILWGAALTRPDFAQGMLG